MATSGDYRNFKSFEDKIYSHTINPKDGMPLEVRGSSVSVISDSAMKADALATALSVMGPEKGMKFADQNNLETIFLLKENGEYVVKLSESFKKTLQ
jgi:thiamine biosynthesis lipoprotein